MKSWLIALRCSALCMAAFPAVAWSQETPPEQAAFTDTVHVQSDRLPADLMRAPVATTDVPSSALTTGRQVGLDEALELVPGAFAQSRSGGQDVRITIRGFGARGAGERSNAGTTRGIRILLDGFPLTEPDGRTSLDLADMGALDHVRVVRSNASALFGSASGGLIDLVSHAPFSRPFYDARVSGGSFGFMRSHANTGFMAGSSSIRVSLSDTRFDGWRRHSESTTTTLQTSIIANPSPQTTLGVFLAGTRNNSKQPGALTLQEMQADPRQADPIFVERNYRRENSLGRVGLRLQHDGEHGNLVVSSFVEPKTLHRSERNRFRDFQRVHTGGSLLYSAPLHTSETSKLRWNNGIDEAFQDGTVLFYNLGPGGTRSSVVFANKREAINTLGFYSELSFQPGTKWDLTAGGRYDFVHYIFEDFQTPKLDDRRVLERFSPRLAAAYRYRPAHNIYAALSGGIEAPAYNEIDPPAPFDTLTGLNPFLEPARSLTVELGTKGIFLLGGAGKSWLRYDAALYGLEVRNDIIPFDGGAYYLTAGKSRREGVELGATLGTSAGLSARLAATLSHNEYVEYKNNFGDFSNNESAGIPPFVLEGRARYDATFGAYLEGIVHGVGRYFADDANTARVPAYQTLDFAVGTRRPVRRTMVDAFFRVGNVLDKKYVSSVFINGVNGRFFEPGLERNYMAGLTLRRE